MAFDATLSGSDLTVEREEEATASFLERWKLRLLGSSQRSSCLSPRSASQSPTGGSAPMRSHAKARSAPDLGAEIGVGRTSRITDLLLSSSAGMERSARCERSEEAEREEQPGEDRDEKRLESESEREKMQLQARKGKGKEKEKEREEGRRQGGSGRWMRSPKERPNPKPKPKQKKSKRHGSFFVDDIVTQWRDDHRFFVTKCCKIAVPFKYVNVIRHHFVVMEVGNARGECAGFLTTQILASGDVTLYAFSSFEAAHRYGRSAATILGKEPERESIAIEAWTEPCVETPVKDIYQFIANHIDNTYHLLKNNCIVVADTVFKYLTSLKARRKLQAYCRCHSPVGLRKYAESPSAEKSPRSTPRRKRSLEWFSKSLFAQSPSKPDN